MSAQAEYALGDRVAWKSAVVTGRDAEGKAVLATMEIEAEIVAVRAVDTGTVLTLRADDGEMYAAFARWDPFTAEISLVGGPINLNAAELLAIDVLSNKDVAGPVNVYFAHVAAALVAAQDQARRAG